MSSVKIKVRWKSVTVLQHEAILEIEKQDLWRYKLDHPRFTDDDKESLIDQADRVSDYIELHHSHFKKLQKAGFKGWFDFKITKTKGNKKTLDRLKPL